MIIKFSNNFESIFYAVLLANITGHCLISKNQPLGLFDDEEFIDIDKFNWRQILEEHDCRFGEIKWLDYESIKFLQFKKDIDMELEKNYQSKYRRTVNLIKQALKFGLFFDNNLKQERAGPSPQKPFELIRAFDRTLV